MNAWPARTARASRSMASGNCSSNFLKRRWRFWDATMNGAVPARAATTSERMKPVFSRRVTTQPTKAAPATVIRKLATFIRIAACCRKNSSFAIDGISARNRLTAGMSLSIPRRRISEFTSSSRARTGGGTAVTRAFSFCFAIGAMTRKYAALMNKPSVAMKTSAIRIAGLIAPSSSLPLPLAPPSPAECACAGPCREARLPLSLAQPSPGDSGFRGRS